jgi:ParB family chromosome partitioning protein
LKKGSSVFFIELNKIDVNPYQPRIEFNQEKLEALADSIRQYGVLQPIVVSRKEEYSEEFGIRTRYQIIAGE